MVMQTLSILEAQREYSQCSVTPATISHYNFNKKINLKQDGSSQDGLPRVQTGVTEVPVCELFLLPVILGGPRGFMCGPRRVGGWPGKPGALRRMEKPAAPFHVRICC